MVHGSSPCGPTTFEAAHCAAFWFLQRSAAKQSYSPKVSLIFVIPDHPWVDSSDGAAVRIAITAARAGHHEATLLSVKREHEKEATPDDDLVEVFSLAAGKAHANLKVGANLNKAAALQANRGICAVGFKTIGAAFQVDQETASSLGLGTIEGCEKHIRPYLNGRDLAAERRGLYVIDFFGLSRETVLHDYPAVYQYLVDRAKPERDQNKNKIFRENWWIIGHPRPIFRQFTAGLTCYIATIETSKHRFFTCLPSQDAPDITLVTFGLSDAVHLGLPSSRIHITWALAAGGRLGVGNDPRYNKTRCFETFPFPAASPEQQGKIRDLAERLDAHRKSQQAQHPELTLTGMYNVLEKVRAGEPLSAKEKTFTNRVWSLCCASCMTNWIAPYSLPMAGMTWPRNWSANPAPPPRCQTNPKPRPRPKRNCCAAWWPSTPNAAPRKPVAWCAGCAPTTRTPTPSTPPSRQWQNWPSQPTSTPPSPTPPPRQTHLAQTDARTSRRRAPCPCPRPVCSRQATDKH